MAYAVFESTNMRSTGRYSKRIFDCVAESDIENGTFGYLNGLNEDGGVIYKFVKGTTSGLTAAQIVVADNPAWTEDESRKTNQRKDKYIIPAGTVFRARTLDVDDEFAISIDGFTSGTKATVEAVTNFKTTAMYVTIDASTGKLVASGSAADNPLIESRIMRKRVAGGTLVTTAHTYGYSRVMYEIKIQTYAGVASTPGATTLGDLTDVDTTGAANGKVLKYNGTQWAVADDATE